MRCLVIFVALLLLACLSPTVWAHEGHSSSPDPPAETSAQLPSAALFPSPAANSDKDTVDKQKAQQKWNIEHGLGEGEEGTAAAAGTVRRQRGRTRPAQRLSSARLSSARRCRPLTRHSLTPLPLVSVAAPFFACPPLDPPGVPSALPADPQSSPLPVVPPVVHSKPLALAPVTKPIPEQIVGVGQWRDRGSRRWGELQMARVESLAD